LRENTQLAAWGSRGLRTTAHFSAGSGRVAIDPALVYVPCMAATPSPTKPRANLGTSLLIIFLFLAVLHPISLPLASYSYGRGWIPVEESWYVSFYAPEFYARRWDHVPAVNAYFRLIDEAYVTGGAHWANSVHSP
jgi:hypothetical protein